ncbi:MAG: hypothetical protein AAB683_01275 [Patescibacteria group bacterium]
MNRYEIKKILGIAVFIIISASIFGYIYFAFRDYINGPYISITKPINGSSIGTSTVLISGQAKRIRDITLNGKPILIDKQGNFAEILLLSPGYNVSMLNAVDKFNRTIEYKLELVYKKDESSVVE